jgi:hypothetical protein
MSFCNILKNKTLQTKNFINLSLFYGQIQLSITEQIKVHSKNSIEHNSMLLFDLQLLKHRIRPL